MAGKITDIAPTLGGIIGGPPGALIGGAVSLLAKVFGLKADAKPEDVMKAIQSDPEAALKLMVLENQFKLDWKEKEIEELKTYLADIQSARQREVEVTKATGKKDVLQLLLALFGVMAPTGLIIYLIRFGLPIMPAETALMVGGFLGIIIGEYKTIFGYFFGSSAGSGKKSEAIEQMIKGR